VFSSDEREQLAEVLINAGAERKGEGFRSETEVLIAEVPVGNWYESGVRLVRPRASVRCSRTRRIYVAAPR
jgi:phenylpyruvate tautomerase PptA (4-oxalocrotonate tautomerase family)